MEDERICKEPQKIPVNQDELNKLAGGLARDISGFRNTPKIIDIYSSREGDGEFVRLFRELLEVRLRKEPFEARGNKPPVIRTFLGSASISDFYSFDLGFYLSDRTRFESMSLKDSSPSLENIPVNPSNIPQPPKFVKKESEVYFSQLAKEGIRALGYICDGTVIDHIPAGQVWRLVELLELNDSNTSKTISLGDNYGSRKLDKKGVLKIGGAELSSEELTLVAFYAEGSTVSLIRMGRVNRKIKMEVPARLEGIISCPNPDCDSNSISHVKNGDYTCKKCTTNFGLDKLRLINYLEFP